MSEDSVFAERISNLLQNGDRRQKLNALQEVEARFQKDGSAFLYESLAPILFRALSDQNERVRERSLILVRTFVEKHGDKDVLKNLIPKVRSRVEVESSEEILIIYLDLMSNLVAKFEKDMSPYVDDVVEIVVFLLPQGAPEVKKVATSCTMHLVEKFPSETYKSTKKIVEKLQENLFHQHWRVRVITIEAIEAVMVKGDNKCVPEIINSITKSLFDDIEHVRMAIAKLAGRWMLELFDRYSFFSCLLPVVLTSLDDESENVRKLSKTLFEKAGRQYYEENEKDYKDRKDYEMEIPNYPGIRPEIGCRLLVEREGSKFLMALAHEMSDWNENVRMKSSSLLAQYALHAESSVTQSLPKILPAMSKACIDSNPKVVENVKKAARIMGFFVPPVYVDMLTSSTGDIILLTSFLSGTNVQPQLGKIASFFRLSFDENELKAILDLVESLFRFEFFEIGEEIWSILISIDGLIENARSSHLLDQFVLSGGGNKEEIFLKYCSAVLKSLNDATWTPRCHEIFVLSSLVEKANFVIDLENFSIFERALSVENEPEVILKVAFILNKFLEERRDEFFIEKAVLILMDHLKWRPGRTAEAIRTVASTCLFTCVKIAKKIDVALIPLVTSLLEDAQVKTRIVILHTIQTMSSHEIVHGEHFDNLLTAVLKRMEDADKKVREYALETIQTLYSEHRRFDARIDNGVLEFVYSTLLIHLDDQNENSRIRVLECLKSLANINPQLFQSKFDSSRLRNKDAHDNIVEHIKNLKVDSK